MMSGEVFNPTKNKAIYTVMATVNALAFKAAVPALVAKIVEATMVDMPPASPKLYFFVEYDPSTTALERTTIEAAIPHWK